MILHPLCSCNIDDALLLNFLSRDGTLSLHLPRLHFTKLHFVATLTLDPLLYNLHHAGGKRKQNKNMKTVR